MDPLTTGHMLLVVLNRHRNYYYRCMCQCKTCECALQQMGTHMRVCGGAMDTHRHGDAQDNPPPARPPFRLKSPCEMKPTPATAPPCLAHVFRGGICVLLCFPLGANLLSIWSANTMPSSSLTEMPAPAWLGGHTHSSPPARGRLDGDCPGARPWRKACLSTAACQHARPTRAPL